MFPHLMMLVTSSSVIAHHQNLKISSAWKFCMTWLRCFRRTFHGNTLLFHVARAYMMEVGRWTKSLVRQKSMNKDASCAVQSSKDFADLASELISSTIVLHISQEEINEAVALAESWEDAPAADGIRSMHYAQCIFKDHKIELRHVTVHF